MKRRRLLPEWVSEFRDRHGKARLRFRRKGYPVYYFKSPFGTEAFREEYRQCIDGETPVGAERTVPGTINDLIARWYRGVEFQGGGDATRMKNRGLLEGFRKSHGSKAVAKIQFEHVDAILAKRAATHPAAARNLRKQLRRLFEFAVKCRMRPDNPVLHTASIKVRKDAGWKAWSEDQVAQYQARHPLGTTARLALELYLWTGNRKADALTLGRQHIKDGAFRLTQQKTGKPMIIPIAPQLAKAIIAMPDNGQLTLLTTHYGRPFSPKGFGARMRKWCDEAGLTGLSTHGLRKTISERMALSGAGNQGIKSVTGHSGDSEVALYTRGVDQERMARETMRKLVEWELANQSDRLATDTAKGAE
jgi:integrase